MKINHPVLHFKPRKRFIIIAASVLLVAMLGTYSFMSYLHWHSFDENSQHAAQTLKQTIDGTLGTDKTLESPADSIDGVINDFHTQFGKDPCTSTVYYQWQTVIPPVQAIQARCNQSFSRSLKVIETATPLSSFLKDQLKIASLVTTTLDATKSLNDYTLASSTWLAFSQSVELPKTESLKTTIDSIRSSAISISTAYSTLAAATKSESKSAFDSGTTDLETAYSSLKTALSSTDSEQKRLTSLFIESYDTL